MRIQKQLLLALMTTAFEGGSNYWLSNAARLIERDNEQNYTKVVIVPDETGDPALDHEYTVTAATMRHGLERLHRAALLKDATFPAAGQHYADAISGDGDAGTADVVLQMGMFGSVIFG